MVETYSIPYFEIMKGNTLRRPLHCKTFALTELLIALAIMAVLAGILLPVLQASRQRGYQTNCANNLRQIGTAFKLYEQDFEDIPPHASYLWNAHYISSPQVLVCKADALGDWGTRITQTYRTGNNGTVIHWLDFAPTKTSYIYVKDSLRGLWEDPFNPINGDNPNPGIFVCQSHGTETGKQYSQAAIIDGQYGRTEWQISGAILRLNFDGSIVARRYIPYPVATGANSVSFEPHRWYLWMDLPSKCKACN